MLSELKKILYVEDEPDIQEVAKLVLESVGGFEVQIANNGQEALEIAADFDPQMILLDAMMPVMDGPTAFGELRKLDGFAEKPIAFMTAKLMDKDISGFLEMGAIGVIAKPFDPMSLSGQIVELWEKAHA